MTSTIQYFSIHCQYNIQRQFDLMQRVGLTSFSGIHSNAKAFIVEDKDVPIYVEMICLAGLDGRTQYEKHIKPELEIFRRLLSARPLEILSSSAG